MEINGLAAFLKVEVELRRLKPYYGDKGRVPISREIAFGPTADRPVHGPSVVQRVPPETRLFDSEVPPPIELFYLSVFYKAQVLAAH